MILERRLDEFVKKQFSLNLDEIEKMTKSELGKLYKKATDLEIELAVNDPEDENMETLQAAWFVDYLYKLLPE